MLRVAKKLWLVDRLWIGTTWLTDEYLKPWWDTLSFNLNIEQFPRVQSSSFIYLVLAILHNEKLFAKTTQLNTYSNCHIFSHLFYRHVFDVSLFTDFTVLYFKYWMCWLHCVDCCFTPTLEMEAGRFPIPRPATVDAICR